MPRIHPDAVRAAQVFHALAEPTRLAILDRLRGGERCVCDLQDLLDAGQSRLSFHLKVLKDAGLVTDRREGRWVYYSLDAELLEESRDLLSELIAPVADASQLKNDRCC
ncbi:MAG: ArsR/SmtB family transcription factor [Gemmatimonadales bacterium]